MFDLAPEPDWQWILGRRSPITWTRNRNNPVRKVAGLLDDQLRDGRPHQIEAGHGWYLDVAPDGQERHPPCTPGRVAVVDVGDGGARRQILPPPDNSDDD